LKEVYIHESAIVETGADIGSGSKIWHFSHVMSSAKIGDDCILGQNIFVGDKVVLGNRVKVQNNVSIYQGVTIEDDVFVGPSVVFTNVINPRSFIERKNEFKSTVIKRGVTLGANATIICGVTIGEYALIGAGAVITKNVLPYQLIVGNPGMPIGWVCQCGDRLDFIEGQATCQKSNKKYQLNPEQVVQVEG